MVEMIAARTAYESLGVGPRELRKLDDAKVIPHLAMTAGGTRFYDREIVDRIAAAPRLNLNLARPALAVRLGPPKPVVEDPINPDGTTWRKFMGWDETWDAETKRRAAGAWWEVKDPESIMGGTLLGFVAHVVVGAWRVTDFDTVSPWRRFHLADHPRRDELIGSIHRLGPGPKTKPLL